MNESPHRITTGDIDAVWFDAGGVLVLPDPTVLIPLLSPYGGAVSVEAHRRAHYAGMAAKSRAGSSDAERAVYDLAYVASVGVEEGLKTLGFLHAIYASMETGGWVQLADRPESSRLGV